MRKEERQQKHDTCATTEVSEANPSVLIERIFQQHHATVPKCVSINCRPVWVVWVVWLRPKGAPRAEEAAFKMPREFSPKLLEFPQRPHRTSKLFHALPDFQRLQPNLLTCEATVSTPSCTTRGTHARVGGRSPSSYKVSGRGMAIAKGVSGNGYFHMRWILCLGWSLQPSCESANWKIKI